MLCARHDPLRLRKQSPLCPALPPAHRCHLAMSLALRMLSTSSTLRCVRGRYLAAAAATLATPWASTRSGVMSSR